MHKLSKFVKFISMVITISELITLNILILNKLLIFLYKKYINTTNDLLNLKSFLPQSNHYPNTHAIPCKYHMHCYDFTTKCMWYFKIFCVLYIFSQTQSHIIYHFITFFLLVLSFWDLSTMIPVIIHHLLCIRLPFFTFSNFLISQFYLFNRLY